jgi:uncharacterized protein
MAGNMRKRKHRLHANIDRILERTQAALTGDSRVLFAYLFGGYGRGRGGPLSDVDIAVYLEPTADPMAAMMDLIGSLSDALSSDEVDLVILNRAPLSLAGRVQESGRVLVDNDPAKRYAYESLVRREFADFRLQEEKLLNRRFGLG